MNVFCSSMIMIIGLLLLHLAVPRVVDSRILNVFIILLYVVVGAVIYLIASYKTGSIKEIFGNNGFRGVFSKFKKSK